MSELRPITACATLPPLGSFGALEIRENAALALTFGAAVRNR